MNSTRPEDIVNTNNSEDVNDVVQVHMFLEKTQLTAGVVHLFEDAVLIFLGGEHGQLVGLGQG